MDNHTEELLSNMHKCITLNHDRIVNNDKIIDVLKKMIDALDEKIDLFIDHIELSRVRTGSTRCSNTLEGVPIETPQEKEE